MARVYESVDGFVEMTARAMTRRRFIRNTSGLALGASLIFAGWPSTGRAYCLTQRLGNNHVCGTSPYCPSTRCRDFHCDTAGSTTTRWRPYQLASCGSESQTNCWSVCDRQSGRQFSCCDCCQRTSDPGSQTTGDPAFACSGCGSSSWYACICHADTGACSC